MFVRNWKQWILGWILPALGVVGWVLGLAYPEEPFLPWMFGIFGLLACTVISVCVHEAAHFYTARVLGLKPLSLTIGHGPIVFEHRFGSLTLVLHANPYSGMVRHSLLQEPVSQSRWRQLLMVSAGPLSNAAGFAAFLVVVAHDPDISDPASAKIIESPLPLEMVLANAYLFLLSAIPFRAKINGLRLPSDGLRILRLLVGWKHKSREPSAGWPWPIQQVEVEALLNAYRQHLEESSLTADERNAALDVFVTCVLMYGAHEFLPEADRYSEELIRNKPTEWTVKGTRGSILVEGRTRSGHRHAD